MGAGAAAASLQPSESRRRWPRPPLGSRPGSPVMHIALLFGSLHFRSPCVLEVLQFTSGPWTRDATFFPDGSFAVRIIPHTREGDSEEINSPVVTASGLARCEGFGDQQFIFSVTGRPALLAAPLSFEADAREWSIDIARVYTIGNPVDGGRVRCGFAGCLPMTQNRSIAKHPAQPPSGAQCPFSVRTVVVSYIFLALAGVFLVARYRPLARRIPATTAALIVTTPVPNSTTRARSGSPLLAVSSQLGRSGGGGGSASTATLTPPKRRCVNFDETGRRYLVSLMGEIPSAVEVTAGRFDRVQQALDDALAKAPSHGNHSIVVAGVCAPLVAVARLDE